MGGGRGFLKDKVGKGVRERSLIQSKKWLEMKMQNSSEADSVALERDAAQGEKKSSERPKHVLTL